MITILITSIGSTTAISAAKALRRSAEPYRIVGTDINPEYEIAGTVFCDVVHRIVPFHDKDYIPQLLEICKKEQVQFVIPIVDQEVEIIAQNASLLLDQGITPCVSDYETVKTCNDKYETWQFLKKRSVDTPRVFLPKEKQMFSLYLPLFLKPRFGVSSRDCYVVTSMEEYEILSNRIDDPVIQKCMTGKQYVVDIVNNLQGKNVTGVVRHEISAKSGLGVKAVTVFHEKIRAYAIHIAEKMDIKGAANVEVFADGDSIQLIEINPRLSAGSILSAVAGINIADLVIGVFSGQRQQTATHSYRENVYMTRYWEEVYFHDKKLMK